MKLGSGQVLFHSTLNTKVTAVRFKTNHNDCRAERVGDWEVSWGRVDEKCVENQWKHRQMNLSK